ncbi:PREDICTED: uncharacterized protein LOC105362972 isoform X2 [Ceratosolen solmsi marchali]|nr:PREDICTED: uncharacterized protein LOC105362972 isoform X2 [Ceratosolen solmsi marchali]
MPTITNSREINGGRNSSVTGFRSSKKQNLLTEYPRINDTSKFNISVNVSSSATPWSSMEMDTNKKSARINSYLFLPPRNNDGSVQSNLSSSQSFDNLSSLPNELSLPSQSSAASFSNLRSSNNLNALGSLDKSSSSSEQVRKAIVIPHRNYGEPGLEVVDYDLQVSNDCDNHQNAGTSIRNNYNSFQDQGSIRSVAKLGSSSNLIYDPNNGLVDSNNNEGINKPLPNYPGRYYQNGYTNKYLTTGYPVNINNQLTNYPTGSPPNYLGGGYNINHGLSNYQSGGFNPIAVNYPGFNSNIGNNLGYNAAYNSATPTYGSAYNSGYNSGFTTAFNFPVGDNYHSNFGNNWGNGYDGQVRECCRMPLSRRFSLSSPGFPGGVSTRNTFSCRYTITKSSPDICRLRLNFRFFNFGGDDQYCNYGYVEIDGRRYCGCKSGLSLQVSFTDYIAKSIFVMNSGYPRSKFSGFLIDVIQEPCRLSESNPSYPSYPSYPLYPQNPSYPYDPRNSNYPNYSGFLQRKTNVLPSVIGKRSLINSPNSTVIYPSMPDPNPHIRNKRNLGYLYSRPSVPFPNSDIQGVSAAVGTHERFFDGRCQNRIFLDWVIASKEAILKHVKCVGFGAPTRNLRIAYPISRNGRSVSSIASECEEIHDKQGEIKSPLYPNNYPNNINKCYRFHKISNFCNIEINVRDFDVEQSEECAKDYFSISKEDTKYCGNSLKNFKTILDLTKVNFMDVYFVSDSNGTGKGFNVSFSQLLCGESSNF